MGISINEQASPLLELPPELRNAIYRLVVVSDNTISLDKDRKRAYQDHTVLLRTCKSTRHEAKSVFFAENTFDMTIDGNHTSALNWLDIVLLRAQSARFLTSLKLQVGVSNSGYQKIVQELKDEIGDCQRLYVTDYFRHGDETRCNVINALHWAAKKGMKTTSLRVKAREDTGEACAAPWTELFFKGILYGIQEWAKEGEGAIIAKPI